MEDGARVIKGPGAISAWDQTHARALDKLRNAKGFVVCTWDDITGDGEMVICAEDGGTLAAKLLIIKTAIALDEACDELLALEDEAA